MLIYSDSDILEILPQQIITSENIINHPNLKLMEKEKKAITSKKKYTKKQPKDK